MALKEEVTLPKQRICSRCHFVSSQEVCKACTLLEGLNKGLPKLGIGKSSKAKKMLEEHARMLNEQKNDSITQVIEELGDETSNHKRKGIKSKKKNNNGSTEDSKNHCNKKDCCKGKCRRTDIKEVDNSKVNTLLEQYSVDDTSNERITDIDTNKVKAIIESSNGDLSVEAEEDDTCAGTCGTLASLHIGF